MLITFSCDVYPITWFELIRKNLDDSQIVRKLIVRKQKATKTERLKG